MGVAKCSDGLVWDGAYTGACKELCSQFLMSLMRALKCFMKKQFEKEGSILKKKALLFSAFPVLALAILAVALIGSMAAQATAPNNAAAAHITKIRGAAVVPYTQANMTYHGGPVMAGTTKAYAIFWEPTGSSVSATYNSLILRYFGDIGGSGLYHNNTQYKASNGTFASGAVLGGSWVDTGAYPSSTISDAQVRQEVSHAMQVKGWTASATHLFFVFTAKGENICYNSSQCSFTTFCAYHSYFNSNTMYAAMPYTGTNLSACGVSKSPNGDINADSTINVASHEQNEAATDPHLNAWYDASGNEIGDKCAWTFGTIAANGSNVTWNGHPYIVQREWDNLKHACVKSGP
jgi:hypothetical protein